MFSFRLILFVILYTHFEHPGYSSDSKLYRGCFTSDYVSEIENQTYNQTSVRLIRLSSQEMIIDVHRTSHEVKCYQIS